MLLFLVLLLCQQPSPSSKPAARPPLVYMCQGSRSYAYHSSARCEGLAWCTTPLRTATRAAAEKQGRYPCGRCRPVR